MSKRKESQPTDSPFPTAESEIFAEVLIQLEKLQKSKETVHSPEAPPQEKKPKH